MKIGLLRVQQCDIVDLLEQQPLVLDLKTFMRLRFGRGRGFERRVRAQRVGNILERGDNRAAVRVGLLESRLRRSLAYDTK